MLRDSRYLPAGSMEDPVNIITGLRSKTTLDLRTEAGLLITRSRCYERDRNE